MFVTIMRFVTLVCGVFILFVGAQQIDPNGYIVYCPCMGRFGNQAEQFLGSLQFARYLNRTLVLPPWIEYASTKVHFVPFDDYILVDPIKEYHRVILIGDFMQDIAPVLWPPEKRHIFCYSSRTGSKTLNDCNPFDGSPFQPFWHHLNITTFEKSIFYSPLQLQTFQAPEWKKNYANESVIAFVGAPSSFPTNLEATQLQKYVFFSDKVSREAEEFKKSRKFQDKPYLAIHLRHGSDWENACKLLKSGEVMSQLFSSSQCTSRVGHPPKQLPHKLCLPSVKTIIGDIRKVLTSVRMSTIFIASDKEDLDLWKTISKTFPDVLVIARSGNLLKGSFEESRSKSTLIIDSYLMANADEFIGNCISSFSAFSSRIRVARDKTKSTHFFGESALRDSTKEEL